MFTGLVQQVGTLTALTRSGEGWTVVVGHKPWQTPLTLGESVAVQGACLTVTYVGGTFFTADLLDETLRKTSFANLKAGAPVNLERALALGDRLGGHIVSGHIDERGTLSTVSDAGRDIVLRVACSSMLAHATVLKGSIAIDGVSLTVSGLGDDWVEVNVIPHTLAATSLATRRPGDSVNLEGDILGKYVARLLGIPTRRAGVTEALLQENGFV